MKVGTLVGLILVVLGAIGVAYGGITYSRQREVAHVGPVQVMGWSSPNSTSRMSRCGASFAGASATPEIARASGRRP